MHACEIFKKRQILYCPESGMINQISEERSSRCEAKMFIFTEIHSDVSVRILNLLAGIFLVVRQFREIA